MKAFSIRQPWAWLVVNGHKDIENRKWRPGNPGLRFRGRVLIHTGLTLELEAASDLRKGIHPVTGEPLALDLPDEFPLGGIVGEAEIVDCVTQSTSPWFVGPYGLVIANARPLPFVPCKGALGFFEVDIDRAGAY